MKVNQGVILVKIGQDGEVSRSQPVLHQMHLLLGLERISDDDQGPPGAILKPFYNLFLQIGPLFLLLTVAYYLHGIIWSGQHFCSIHLLRHCEIFGRKSIADLILRQGT